MNETGQRSSRRRRRLILRLITLSCTVAALEVVARVAFVFLPGFEKARAGLSGEMAKKAQFQNSIGQAYLLYAPAPSYRNESGVQHNAHGYRGPMVPIKKQPGVKRVLFLGGSTTYGWKVATPKQTYPAQLGGLLNLDLPDDVRRVEVINGGIPFGTSAEMLTHYIFKYHYYKPDLVVINAGGNDSIPFTMPNYQPDYNHWRKPLLSVPTLSTLGRFLLNSRLLSAMILPITSGILPDRLSIIRDGIPLIQWYRFYGRPEDVPDDMNAFRQNLSRLIDMIRDSGGRVLLVPWRGKPNTHPKFQSMIEKNEAVLLDIASEKALVVAPFPASVIDRADWADRGHLNRSGCLAKATHILPYARQVLFNNEQQ